MLAADIRGLWKGRYLLADLVAHIEQADRKILGVVELHQPFSKTILYHFTGQVTGNRIQASHHSGKSFDGHVEADTITGTITTEKGTQLRVSAKRVSNSPQAR